MKRDYQPAILALGGNLGDRKSNIEAAVKLIDKVKGIKVRELSPLVESHALTPAGVDESKPNYINAVLRVDTRLKPKRLLKELRNIETALGRVRVETWGSRTMDIDIITLGNKIVAKKKLQIPHPRAFQRAFVLVPWSMLDAKAVLPGHGAVSNLLETLHDKVWVVE